MKTLIGLGLLMMSFGLTANTAAASECCQIEQGYQMIWSGADSLMTYRELAAYCGPILWYSPDEPNVGGARGKDIRMPTNFPFEEAADAPLVYYRIRTLLNRENKSKVVVHEDPERIDTEINLGELVGIDLDYFFYYPSEEGLGAHKHDVEATYFKIFIHHCEGCEVQHYAIYVERTIAKAHGLLWYDNTLVTDEYTEFPMTILVEEGKHASCTDKNHDGIYTPTFDVNRRINDAWGIRDIMRGGGLYSGSFQAWMAKTRLLNGRVFPPLPTDSPLREPFTVDGEYAPENAIYELRPFPRPSDVDTEAEPKLLPFVDDKGDEDWPEVMSASDLRSVVRWMDEERFINSLSIAFRWDGLNYGSRKSTGGLSFAFPLLIVKNVSDPVAGGWFVNRIYLKDKNLRDISWNVLYTSSASRWVDGYFAVGWEWDEDDFGEVHTDMMTETGVKFRVNMNHSPLKFLTALGTDFWGMRIGVKNKGIFNWESIGYAVEFGAGVW
ncbi:MAG: hypothetical protein ACI9UK_001226 [Candidatus Krumholzibacteriia bacterium]|jgi:hypothetical protein